MRQDKRKKLEEAGWRVGGLVLIHFDDSRLISATKLAKVIVRDI